MMRYDKRIYPEISKEEFDKYVYPILDTIMNLKIKENIKFEENEIFIIKDEMYPYHNSSLLVARSLWEQAWDSSLEYMFLNFYKFKQNMLEMLSDVVFSHFIRCFAEQIKSSELKYKDYKEYNIDIRKTG